MTKANYFFKLILVSLGILTVTVACGEKSVKQSEKQETVQMVGEQMTGENSSDEDTAQEETGSQSVAAGIEIDEWAALQAESRTDVSFAKMNESYLEGVMSIDLKKVEKYVVYVDASGSTVDEFGIFKPQEGEADVVQKMVQSYLDMRLETWMEEYMPDQKPKVQKAELLAKNGYLIYAILSQEDKENLFKEFELTLSGEADH